MKKVVSLLCAMALAVLCAVPAFAEATPGEVAKDAALSILVSEDKADQASQKNAEDIASWANDHPDETLTAEQSKAIVEVIDAMIAKDATAAKTVEVPASEKVVNPVSFQAAGENNINAETVSLTKESDNKLVLTAEWENGEPARGVKVTITGLENGVYQVNRLKSGTSACGGPRQCTNGTLTIGVAGFSSYEIVKIASAGTGSSTTTTTTASATAPVDYAKVDAEYYTCPACGYHNWTGVNGGYKCDNCGHIESKDLSGYPNVKGAATLTAGTATKSAANPIKATGADLDMAVLFVLGAAAAVVGGGALVVKKQGLGK